MVQVNLLHRFGIDPAGVAIQSISSIDRACDGASGIYLSFHLVTALQVAMLGDHEALVVVDWGTCAVWDTGEALVLVGALQHNEQTLLASMTVKTS